MRRAKPVTVVETPEFLAATRELLGVEERAALIDYLAHNPSAGARVIYFFHNESMPLFALTAFAKNRRADLSQADRNDFKRLVAQLVRNHEGRGR